MLVRGYTRAHHDSVKRAGNNTVSSFGNGCVGGGGGWVPECVMGVIRSVEREVWMRHG
eukprot:NODE_5653_length_396_cov_15.095101_g4958_i0.p1 GENE.NODE_5653_length_396_cov_15.095101_g4958_i0~~NODE_5653_length_396_cov_15.095101_g4958_i0.p1  ORF type:complete len:58 (+),score=7.48 NODE_5653_length_396_cov_15.095101_g4958_i0:126-299(+)